MYIPCQIMDSSSLESQAPSVAFLRGLCCPCMSTPRNRHSNHDRNRPSTTDVSNQHFIPKMKHINVNFCNYVDNVSQTFQRELEDPEMVFSRHRAAVIAGHRFLNNHDGIWNLQNMAPPLPQVAPPPLPPRKLSSFFPPMEPLNLHRGSVFSNNPQIFRELELSEAHAASASLKNAQHRKEGKTKRLSPPIVATPPSLPSLSANINEQCQSTNQAPRGSSASIACPYLSPIDVVSILIQFLTLIKIDLI